MDKAEEPTNLAREIHEAQLAAHYAQLPAMIVAPCLGGLFSLWVLWRAVDTRLMCIGFGAILLLSALRYLAYRRFMSATPTERAQPHWARMAIAASGISGLIWGSAALFLYPPHDPAYQIYMVLIFALIPLAPIAALACYVPTFFAYYIPCATPFLVRLILQGDRAGWACAALLLMLMAATVTFARRYYLNLFEVLRLRLLMERQRDTVQAASESKTRFLAAASHDLRQPLHAATLFAEALHDDLHNEAGYANQRGVLNAMHALRELLDRLLDVAQLDAGGIQARGSAFALQPLLDKLVHEFTPQAHRQGLVIRAARTHCWAHSDAGLLEDLLRNLLSNALRYTRQGGVLIGVRRRSPAVLVQVSDTGIGIDSSHHSRIFEEFFQVDNRERDRGKGLGLGLAVVSRLAKLLNAEIQLHSIPGRGTSFTVAVPRTSAPLDEAPLPSMAPAFDSALLGRKILIVESDSDVRAGMSGLCTTWGCHPRAVANENEALQLIDYWQPEIMVLDYTLAHSRSGVQLAQDIERELQRRIPTLIVTGDLSEQSRVAATHAGYLLAHKPLRAGNLKALLGHLLV